MRRQLVDRETGEVVEAPDQVKGHEIGKRDYVIIEDEEIEFVAIESTHTIDIETFVPRAEIDDVYIDQPYYLTPDGRVAEEAFAVIREAMREKQVVGIGRVVLYRRERPIMLEPAEKGWSPERCATPTRCERIASISRTSARLRSAMRCLISRPTLSPENSRTLTRNGSRTATRTP